MLKNLNYVTEDIKDNVLNLLVKEFHEPGQITLGQTHQSNWVLSFQT